MKGFRILSGLLVAGAVGCQAGPVYPPLGSTLFLYEDSVDTEPGAMRAVEVLVTNADGDLALNNVLVEFFGYGVTLIPTEAIVGTSNQPDANGESAVSWCDAYEDDPEAYEECFNEYYFDFMGLDASISPFYARIPTDERGVARLYMIAFCAISNGALICADDTEDQEGSIVVDIGVDSASLLVTYTADTQEE